MTGKQSMITGSVGERSVVSTLRAVASIHEGVANTHDEGDPRKNVEVPLGMLREVAYVMRVAADRLEECESDQEVTA